MSKTNFQFDRKMLTVLGLYGGVVLVAAVIAAVCIPVWKGLSQPIPVGTGKSFIDVQKVEKVYSVLVPD